MKKDKNANLKPFAKGQSGNPNGRPPDALNAAMKKLTKAELEDIASILIRESIGDLKRRLKDQNTTILQGLILGIAAKAISKGDASAFNALLDRLLGKVKEQHHFTGNSGPITNVTVRIPSNGREVKTDKLDWEK